MILRAPVLVVHFAIDCATKSRPDPAGRAHLADTIHAQEASAPGAHAGGLDQEWPLDGR